MMAGNVIDRRHLGRFGLLALLAAPLGACVGVAYPYATAGAPVRQPGYTLSSDVLFDFGSATLRPGASEALDQILGQIRAAFPYPAIRVEGYTDSIGTRAANLVLSQRRAQAVERWLMDHGIPPAAITIAGFGEANPIAANRLPNGADNPAGRAQNRRVVLIPSAA